MKQDVWLEPDRLVTYYVGVVDEDGKEPDDPCYHRVPCVFAAYECGKMTNMEDFNFPTATENWHVVGFGLFEEHWAGELIGVAKVGHPLYVCRCDSLYCRALAFELTL